MSENPVERFQVRDPQGNVYGPADMAMLRDWVSQGRIVAGMHIASDADGLWVEVSAHPGLEDLFQASGGPAVAPRTVTPIQPVTRVVGQTPAYPSTPSANYPAPGAPLPSVSGSDLGYADSGPRTHILATLSLIAGIVAAPGIFCTPACVCLGGPYTAVFGATAIILGIIGLTKIKADPQRYSGYGLAMTGLVMGVASIVLGILLFIIWFLVGMHHP